VPVVPAGQAVFEVSWPALPGVSATQERPLQRVPFGHAQRPRVSAAMPPLQAAVSAGGGDLEVSVAPPAD
jgi:hypothetical protein